MEDEITVENINKLHPVSSTSIEDSTKKFIRIIKEDDNKPTEKSNIGETENRVYEVLYENQRGLFFFGLPKFSSKALNQMDPPPWTDRYHKYSPMDIYTFQLPDPTWEWVNNEWLIDMSGDVDEEGWEYSLGFNFNSWHGCYKSFRSFVRRRRWIRLRKKIVDDHDAYEYLSKINIKSKAKSGIDEIWYKVKCSKLDREKLNVINEYIKNGGEINDFIEKMEDFISLFDHHGSKKALLEILLETRNQKVINELKQKKFMKFYSDSKSLLLLF